MSIGTTTRKAGPFAGNGSQTVFAYAFKIFATTDLMVVKASSLGVETELVLGVDFTATMNPDQDAAPGGNVTLGTALAVGETLVVLSDVPQLQGVVVTNGGGFFPAVFNGVFDKLTIFCQQLAEKVGRGVIVPATDPTQTLTLPTKAARANNTLAFDADGLPTPGPSPASITAAVASAQGYANDASGSATDAEVAQAAAEAALAQTLTAFDQFDDRYLGSKTADPTLDNDGNALIAGALYFNSVAGEMRVYTGSVWVAAYVSGSGFVPITRKVLGGGLAMQSSTGALSADVTVTVDAATGAELLAGATAAKAVTPDAAADSREPNVLTGQSGSVTPSLANTSIHHFTLSGNITSFNFPSNIGRAGQPFVFRFIQPSSGGPRTISAAAAYRVPGLSAITLSTAANAADELSGYILPGGVLASCRFNKNV